MVALNCIHHEPLHWILRMNGTTSEWVPYSQRFLIFLLWSCFPIFPALVLFCAVPESQEHVGTSRKTSNSNSHQRQLELNPFDQSPDLGQQFLSLEHGKIVVGFAPASQCQRPGPEAVKRQGQDQNQNHNPFDSTPDPTQLFIKPNSTGTYTLVPDVQVKSAKGQAHNAQTRAIKESKSKIYQNPFKTAPDTNQSKINTYVTCSRTKHEQQKQQKKSQLQDRVSLCFVRWFQPNLSSSFFQSA